MNFSPKIGNVDVREGGAIDLSFYSSQVTLFGPRGIIGRSIAIHEKPIEYNRFPDIYGIPAGEESISYQSEEAAVGNILACGVITITENEPPQPAGPAAPADTMWMGE